MKNIALFSGFMCVGTSMVCLTKRANSRGCAFQVKRAFVLIMIFSLLFPPIFAHSTSAQTSLPTRSEIMYVDWSLVSPEDFGSWGLGWNVWFQIDNVSTVLIPLNLSIPAFNNGFEGATFEAAPYGFQTWWLTFDASYSPMDVGLAENYTNAVCAQFQKAFSLNGSITDETYEVDNQTGMVTVYCNLGYFPETAEFVTQLEQYKPDDGFGQLITADTINEYLERQGITTNSTINVVYGLGRVDGGAFYWSFETAFDGTEGPVKNGDHANLNLNELLNRTGDIAPAAEGSSTISVEIPEGNVPGNGQVASMTLESVSPSEAVTEVHGTAIITYNLTAPIGNIVAAVKVRIENGPASLFQNPITIVTAVAVPVVLILAIAVIIRRRRKPQESETQEMHHSLKSNLVEEKKGGEKP